MAYLNNFASRFRKGITSPFLSEADWCARCRSEVDTETEAAHRGTTFVYRRRCGRCGLVLARGVYDNVAVVTGEPISPTAVAWTEAPGEDRR